MCKKLILGLLAMIVLSASMTQAATLRIVDLPAIGTDDDIGINSGKTYTHTFDFGSNAPVTINDVPFEQGTTSFITSVYTGTSIWGYGYTIDDTRRPMEIGIHPGKTDPPPAADGDSMWLFRDFIWHFGGNRGEGTILKLSDLTAGVTYSTRYYYAPFAITDARVITFEADGESNGIFSDTIELSIDTGGAHYLDYTFTADDTDVTLRFITHNDNAAAHIDGLSNEIAESVMKAYHPNPKEGDLYEKTWVSLTWKPGAEVVSHDVYMGNNFDDVNDATRDSEVFRGNYDIGEEYYYAGFDPFAYPAGLVPGTTYYWRIDEVNDANAASPWKGKVWSFTVADFIGIDDFESYDSDENQICYAWKDGLGYGTPDVPPYYVGNGTGAAVGDKNTPSYTEETIVHGGKQSMPFSYNNTGGTASSEAELTLTPAQDWTAHGIQTLSLWFYGNAANTPVQLYVNINGVQVLYDGDATNLTRSAWQVWNIDLALFATDLQNVTSIAIGVQGNDATGKLLFDDIRLYALARQLITPTEPDTANLVGHWMFDEGSGTTASDSSGNNNHGTVQGDAQWVAAGKVGGALAFDGVDDMVIVTQNSGLPIYNNGTDNGYSIAMWVKGGPQSDMRIFSEGSSTSNTPLFNLGTQNAGATGQLDVYIRPDTGTTFGHAYSEMEPFDDTWHHIVWVDANGTATVYVDGHLDGGDFNYTRGTMALNTTTIGGILRAAPSHFFTGQIDDVHLYSRALSYAEIAWLAGVTNPFDKPF